jgi:hypothetical protein
VFPLLQGLGELLNLNIVISFLWPLVNTNLKIMKNQTEDQAYRMQVIPDFNRSESFVIANGWKIL